MFRFLKSLFQHRCPTCRQLLHSQADSLLCAKHCPNGHYQEETYSTLGVRIIYENRK